MREFVVLLVIFSVFVLYAAVYSLSRWINVLQAVVAAHYTHLNARIDLEVANRQVEDLNIKQMIIEDWRERPIGDEN